MTINYKRSLARPYYYFVCGGLGGVSGWFLIALLGRNATGAPTLAMLLVQGAVLGSLIGLGGGIFDGLAAHSVARVVRFGGTSMLLGLLAGCFALPLVQTIYAALVARDSEPATSTPAALAIGSMCWLLFGGLIGLGEGVSRGSQSWKGMLGGMIGAVVGGGFYEVARAGGPNASQAVLAFALLILGGSIAAAVALVSAILTDAWLLIQNGKLKGYELPISKYVHKDLGTRKPGIIGSRSDAHVYLPGDSGILPQHASISYSSGAPTLTVTPEARRQRAITKVNGRNVSTSWPLRNGDRIEIGSTTLLYRHGKSPKASSSTLGIY